MLPKHKDQSGAFSHHYVELIHLLAKQAVSDHLTQQSAQNKAVSTDDSNRVIQISDESQYSVTNEIARNNNYENT